MDWYILILSIINWNGLMFHRRNFGILISLLLLTACGQKGALYLPTNNPQLEQQKSQDTEDTKTQLQQNPAEEETSPEPDGHMP